MDFKAYPKTQRLSNEIVTIAEKIDGTNGVLHVDHQSRTVLAGSRSKWLINDGSRSWDNHGFGAWVKENEEKLLNLPEGLHYGEWYGKGINRNYGMKDRKLMLFNRSRYQNILEEGDFPTELELETVISLVSVSELPEEALRIKARVDKEGSYHVPGFMKTEGVIFRFQLSAKVYKEVWDK